MQDGATMLPDDLKNYRPSEDDLFSKIPPDLAWVLLAAAMVAGYIVDRWA